MGQKQKTKKRRRKKRESERWYNNGQLHIANATSGGAHKAAWANLVNALFCLINNETETWIRNNESTNKLQ